MTFTIYNTLTRKKEPFIPLEDGKVGMYCCGPTVYNYAHVGNLRTYVFEDILRRVLEYNEFQVNHVMNITDIGHLTDDGDEGEDKLEISAKKQNKSVNEIAEFYTEAFFDDILDLNIISPKIIAKATEHIPEIINLIKILFEKGYAYESQGNVYYDISKFKYYSDLGKLNLENVKSTERVEEDENKRNKQDFVLWFTDSKFKNHSMKWESPWGVGYPGWHIECSAMSSKYLGEQFDIHCGGVDHTQVHHTNEIAQSEGAFGKRPWVRYWIHGEFLVLNKGKMSKSENNFITLSTLKEKGYEPLLFRYYCLNTHYRQKLNFSFEALDNAKNGFQSLKNKIINVKNSIENLEKKALDESEPEKTQEFLEFETKFLQAINDDLNMPQALAVLYEVLKSDLSDGDKYFLICDFDKVFGLNFKELKKESFVEEIPQKIKGLLDKREQARKDKNWDLADKIRDEINSKGYSIKDSDNGPIVESLN